MPSWLTVTLKWGGIAVAIVFAAALTRPGERPQGDHRRLADLHQLTGRFI